MLQCGWAIEIHNMTNPALKAIALVEYAQHLRQYGERAPGGSETWRDWEIVAGEFLMDLVRGE